MELSNGILSLSFDPQTGSLIQIIDLQSGLKILSDPSEGRLFRLFIPDDTEWIDRYLDSHTSPPPQMNLEEDGLTILFTDLRIADGSPAQVTARVQVSLPPGSDEAFFNLELENNSPHLVMETIFPWVGGWRGFGSPNGSKSSRGQVLCGTHWPVDPFTQLRKNDGWNLLDSTRKHLIGFPHLNIPMCDVTNGNVGLSINFYPVVRDLNFDFFLLDLNEAYGDPHPSFGWVHRPFLAPGKRWQSGPVGIAPHQGGWEASAMRMKRWLNTWWKAPALPQSLRGAIGFQNVYFREFTGRELRPLSCLPSLARHGLEHGLEHFIVWDMPLMGMYVRPGSDGLFTDSPSRIQELKKALLETRMMGVKVSPLVNLRLGTQWHPFWKEHGEEWAIRSYYGLPAQETLPLRAHTSALINRYLDQGGVRFCQSHPGFQEWALEQTRRVLDLGFNAIFLDQPFSEDTCFSPQHGHASPTPGHDGTCTWIPRAAQLVHEHCPGSYVIGEVPDIWNTQFFELWWFWDWSWLRPEVFRTVLPHSLQSWVIDAYDHPDQVGKAFAMGFLLNLNVRSLEKTLPDVPEFANRIRELAVLRKKTQSSTVDGTFLHHAGLELDTDAAITTALYDCGSKLGIALGEGSPSAKGGGRLRLSVSSQALQERRVESIILHRQNGSSQVVPIQYNNDTLTLESNLQRWECAVIEIELGSK